MIHVNAASQTLCCALAAGVTLTALACEEPPRSTPAATSSTATTPSSAAATAATASNTTANASPPSAENSARQADTRPLAADSQQALLALLGSFDPADELFLRKHVDIGGPAAMNQGNQEIAHHDISRARCLERLRGVDLQSAEQRRICGGRANMVPVYEGGAADAAAVCIDIFEFPNQPCELPFVWAGPAQARAVCKKLGKRLCRQEEWMLACDGDPAGGARSRYAYGDRVDLEACNTNKHMQEQQSEPCDATTAKSAWKTCGTHTEPSGSFPRCRSRLGVFDLHGNVAEAMTRRDPDGKTYSQLKGSAFFYVDVQRKDGGEAKRENYADNCRHDPRWHVQEMTRAWHVNYHLGFRCCADVVR